MSKITLDNLSDNLKEYLEGLGLSEEQVLNLINENGLDEEELKAMLKETMSINELNTNSKTVIGAINELFQSANNGKELIANAIGEPLNAEDTFSAMSTDINGLLSTFKTNMMNNGVTVESSDRFKALIDKIATLADNEGKGIQYASGICTQSSYSSGEYDSGATYTFNIQTNLTFVPDIIFVRMGYNNVGSTSDISNKSNLYISNLMEFNEDYTGYSDINKISIDNITKESFQINVTTSRDSTGLFNDWYALGVGEEDTTLRDSLASILTEEGVEVTEEDDMASLISKVDEEFDRQVVPAGDAVASNVLSGKTFINSTGSTLTGTMANRGGSQTITPGTSNKTLNSGYYSGNITIAGDSNLIASNIVSGKSIFGVSGSAKTGGRQYATGTFTLSQDLGGEYSTVESTYTVNYSPGFTPSMVFVLIPLAQSGGYGIARNVFISNLKTSSVEGGSYGGDMAITDISSSSFTLWLNWEIAIYANTYTWYAFE